MNSFLSSLVYGNSADIEDVDFDDFDIAHGIESSGLYEEDAGEGKDATRRKQQGRGVLNDDVADENAGGISVTKSKFSKSLAKNKTKNDNNHYQVIDLDDDSDGISTKREEEEGKAEEEEKEEFLSAEKSQAITASLDAFYSSEYNGVQHHHSIVHEPLLSFAPRRKDGDAEESEQRKELRLLTDRRSKEWKRATKRWQKRRVNLVDEQDVGNIAAKRARTMLRLGLVQPRRQHQQHQLHQQPRQVEESTTETSSMTAQANHTKKRKRYLADAKLDSPVQPEDLDSSDEEQGHIFARLSQNQEQQPDNDEEEQQRQQEDESPTKKKAKAKAVKAAQRFNERLERARMSYFEGMDFWQKGRTAPSREEFPFGLLEPKQLLAPLNIAHLPAAHERKASDDGKKKRSSWDNVSLANEKSRRPDTNAFLLFPIHHKVHNIDNEFLHRRQLVRLATRHILSSIENGDPLVGLEDDRLLRALWETPSPEQDRRLFFLLTQTQQQGINLQTYLSHQWHDDAASSSKSFVAKRLGVVDNWEHSDLLGPSHMGGKPLLASQVRYLYDQERKRLVRLYSSGLKLADKPTTEDSSAADDAEVTIKDGGLTAQQNRQEHEHIDLIAPPSVNYIHIPGSIPSIPSFPLNETGFAFGPRDKHIAFRHSGPVDEANYNLTLSSLLSRISATSPDLHENGGNNEPRRALQQQLQTLVDQSPTATSTMLQRFFRGRQDMPTSELPLVQYYRTLMAYCAFVASGCPQPTKPIENHTAASTHDAKEESTDTDGDVASELPSENSALEDMERLSLDVVATKIFGVCQNHIQHDGLQAFPRLHLTYVLSRVARMLPSSAAEILSRPLDDWEHRTPFDILRILMEHMEEEHMLDDDTGIAVAIWSSRVKVRVEELEYVLHQAASSLCKCTERDPVDVNYHAWYLGTLCTAMLLCSGNRVGLKAFPFPSSYYENDSELSESSSFGSGSANMKSRRDHPRKTLAGFYRLREAVKKGLKVFMHLCRRQPDCTRAHLALSSFLEWNQVVALVAGRECHRDDRLKELRDVHHHHATQWAVADRSSKAMKYLHRLIENYEDLPCDVKLNHLATAVENDPDNIELWRRLVAALGPVGKLELSGKCQRGCAEENCSECSMLHVDFHIDHHNLEARKSSGQWWGSDRVSWWYHHFLALPYDASDEPVSPSEIQQLEIAMKAIQCQDAHTGDLAPGRRDVKPPQNDFEWFCDIEEDNGLHDGEGSTRTDPLSENELPKSFTTVLKTEGKREGPGFSVSSVSEDSISEAEVSYLKLAVICHLYGVTHKGFSQGVFQMARRSVDGHFQIKHCHERRYLQELSNMGLDISQYLKRFQALSR